MKDLSFKSLFTKENSSFWLRTDMKFARTKTSELFDRVDKNPTTRYLRKILKVLPNECFIAGGAAKDLYTNNTEKIADIDIYSPNEEVAKKAYEALLTIKGEAVRQSKMAIAVNIKEGMPQASLIKIVYFDNMEHCLDSFDFTVCQFAVGSEESICNPMGLLDHQNKKLNIHVLQPQTDCLYRLVKYINKGYQPTSACLDTIHDFMSGNHVPVRNERPSTYGAGQINEALGSIPVIPPASFNYPTPAPASPHNGSAAPLVSGTFWQRALEREQSILREAEAERDINSGNLYNIIHDSGPEPELVTTPYLEMVQATENETFRQQLAQLHSSTTGNALLPGDSTVVVVPSGRPSNTRIIRGRGGLVQSSSGPRRNRNGDIL